MPRIVTLVYEDSKGGPFLYISVDGELASCSPQGTRPQLEVGDVGAAVAAVARLLGAEVEVENTRVLYDARGNRVEE